MDVHSFGNCFASAGMDTTVKIWGLNDNSSSSDIGPIQRAILDSTKWTKEEGSERRFPTFIQQYPLFSTNTVHSDYVDSIKWVGDLILSKSTKNKVLLWGPDSSRAKDMALIVAEYNISNDHIWYIRMDVCIPLDIFAVGNKEGKCFVYSLSQNEGEEEGRIDEDDEEDEEETQITAISRRTVQERNRRERSGSKRTTFSGPVLLHHPRYRIDIRTVDVTTLEIFALLICSV